MMAERLALWYWGRFVREDRCLCRIGLGRLCGWIEETYVFPRFSDASRDVARREPSAVEPLNESKEVGG